MFDWIGDAIDWFGDGISSLWDSTIGGATEAIGDWIWEAMFEWLFDLIYGGIADLFEFIDSSTSDIFALTWVDMKVSADGRTPELYDITIVSKDAVVTDLENNSPVAEIVSKNKTKVNVPMTVRADLADDCLKSNITVSWDCESDNLKFSGSSELITSVICSETGSYEIICTVNDGEKTVQSSKTIVCEPADSYTILYCKIS